MRRGGRAAFAAAALAAAVLLATGCSSGAAPGEVTPVVEVRTAVAQRGPLEQWVRGQAVLYPLHQAVIAPKISAPVEKLYVQRGDRVRAGQLLAVLENQDLAAAAEQARGNLEAAQAGYATALGSTIPAALQKARLDVAAAKKAYDNARRVYRNSQTMYQQGAIPRRTLDQAGAAQVDAGNAYQLARQHWRALEQGGGRLQAVKAAKGRLEAAQGQAAAAEALLRYSRITSPIRGVVTDRPVYPGELATPSSPLMTIMELDRVVARVPLPAAQAALLKPGDAATITAPGRRPLPARVAIVSPAADPGSTTVEVWVEAENPKHELRPGIAVEVTMLARTLPQALTVPAASVLTDASGQTSVMVVGAGDRAQQTDVGTGVRGSGRVQILSGITAGQKVVTTGAYGLPDGARLRIVPTPPARSTAPSAPRDATP